MLFRSTKYLPHLESVSVVPVGLSRYREGLYPLEPFTREDAREVLRSIHGWQEKIYREHGTHFIHASDEWYILAQEELPEEERYDGYLQLENGVGMTRLLLSEFARGREQLRRERQIPDMSVREELSIATGRLAYPYIRRMAQEMTEDFPGLEIHVYAIRNDFFGEMITVSGLLTGQDILAQLQDKPLGRRLLLPQNVLRSGETVFLDDLTLEELKNTLQVEINIVKSSGYDFIDAVLGRD